MLEALLPPPRRLGRPRTRDLRTIVNAILHILATDCQWREPPRDFPPPSTVRGYFYCWCDDGTWHWINARLVACAHWALGRNIAPSAGIIDSQSASTTESGGPRGIDAGKRIKGRKRHIVTDTQGFLLVGQVHQANIEDPHGAVPLLHTLPRSFPKLRHIFADRIYCGPQLRAAVDDCGPCTSEDAAILAQHHEVEADRDHLAACRRQHFPTQFDRVVMAIDAVTQAKDAALLLHPFFIASGHARFDAGMADRFEGARQVTGLGLPESADDGTALSASGSFHTEMYCSTKALMSVMPLLEVAGPRRR